MPHKINPIQFENAEGKTTFQHVANSRNVFAIGALQAARWIKSKEIGEDEEKSYEKNVQNITDKHITTVDEKVSSKEKEIMTI